MKVIDKDALEYFKDKIQEKLNEKADKSAVPTDYVKSTDSRLSNARTPLAHTHTKSQITDFPSVPTRTSELINNSGFLTADDVKQIIDEELGVIVNGEF